jgi:hypothetical protein
MRPPGIVEQSAETRPASDRAELRVVVACRPRPCEFSLFRSGVLRLLDSKWPEVLQSRELTQDSRADEPTRVDVSARELVAFGPNESEGVDSVDEALAFALAEAACYEQ